MNSEGIINKKMVKEIPKSVKESKEKSLFRFFFILNEKWKKLKKKKKWKKIKKKILKKKRKKILKNINKM